MKSLLFLTVVGLSTWVAYTLQRKQQLKELPTAEHKKQWASTTQWCGTKWERVS